MSGIWLAVFGLTVFFLGFRFYSKFIAERIYRLDPDFVTPTYQSFWSPTTSYPHARCRFASAWPITADRRWWKSSGLAMFGEP